MLPPSFERKRVSVRGIIADLWDARDLVVQFVRRDITVRYAQAIMGFAWALLMPALIVCSGLLFRVVVATLANTTVEGASVASLAAKAIPWAFFSGGISVASASVIAQANLIGKIYFPREALPIASVLAQCVDLVVGLALLAIVLPILHVPFTLNALQGVLALGLLVIFTTGCALALSCANLFFRDVKYIVQLVLNFGVFATPVFFEPQMLGRKGGAIMLALPLSPFIQGIDLAVVHGQSLFETHYQSTPKGPVAVWEPWLLVYAIALAFFALFAGLMIFRRASSRFAEMA
jgi:ABC-type polysaccharide/polyol phosphate export permease